MNRFSIFLAALTIAASAVPSLAGTIPYPHTGTIAPQVKTYAEASGGINIYYYGSTAAFTDYVDVFDVQTGYKSGPVLNNHATALGTEISVGTTPGQINKGDQLVFYIISPEGNFASIAGDSADSVNHAYITDINAGVLNGVSIPSGIFVGLEDEINGASDFNYNDDTFVFTGVSAPSIGVGTGTTGATPEPGSFVLLGTGVLAAAGTLRRRFISR